MREYAYVWSNDPLQPKIRLTLESPVTPVFMVTPNPWIYIQTVQGKPASHTLTLAPREKGVLIESYHHDQGEWLSLTLEGPDKDGKYILKATAKDDSSGRHMGWITLALSGAKIREFAIRVTALINRRPANPDAAAEKAGREVLRSGARNEVIN